MNVSRILWWLRLAPFFEWRDRQRTRKSLLATPGVDRLVRTVMDYRYGRHAWRVHNENLEALVKSNGQGESWWGLIGPLRSHHTRSWLANVSLDMNGVRQQDRHPPEAPYKLEPAQDQTEKRYYADAYADTEPNDLDDTTDYTDPSKPHQR